jgi:hypothetical protein
MSSSTGKMQPESNLGGIRPPTVFGSGCATLEGKCRRKKFPLYINPSTCSVSQTLNEVWVYRSFNGFQNSRGEVVGTNPLLQKARSFLLPCQHKTVRTRPVWHYRRDRRDVRPSRSTPLGAAKPQCRGGPENEFALESSELAGPADGRHPVMGWNSQTGRSVAVPGHSNSRRDEG